MVRRLLFKFRYLSARLRGVQLGKGVSISRGATLEPGVSIGARCFLGANCHIGGKVTIGDDCFIGPGAQIGGHSSVSIGRDCLIAEYVTIRDADHGTADIPFRSQAMVSKPVIIGNGVWLGAKATVLKGVILGDHCIAAAGAVVISSAPERSLLAGVPAAIKDTVGP